MEFNAQINKFQTLGIYNYKFDEVGNVIANSSSMEFSYNYLSLPLWNSNYNNTKIQSYYDVNFAEFVPEEPILTDDGNLIESSDDLLENVQTTNQDLAAENSQLLSRIDELVSLSEEDSSVAENSAIKQVILDLRMALKQGKEEKDFSVTFPYTPLKTE
jgi:hypothetical protein